MKTVIVNGKEYQQVLQPQDSWNENPCWDCVFGQEDGECHAPQEIHDFDYTLEHSCGFFFSSPNYVYEEVKNK